jgi:hypothetical protein
VSQTTLAGRPVFVFRQDAKYAVIDKEAGKLLEANYPIGKPNDKALQALPSELAKAYAATAKPFIRHEVDASGGDIYKLETSLVEKREDGLYHSDSTYFGANRGVPFEDVLRHAVAEAHRMSSLEYLPGNHWEPRSSGGLRGAVLSLFGRPRAQVGLGASRLKWDGSVVPNSMTWRVQYTRERGVFVSWQNEANKMVGEVRIDGTEGVQAKSHYDRAVAAVPQLVAAIRQHGETMGIAADAPMFWSQLDSLPR